MSALTGVQGIVLDLEGTTTPIAFVHEVLFPFARARLDAACAAAARDPELAAALARLRAEHRGEREAPPFGDGAPYARWLMDRDVKSTGLKALQGLLWRQGYQDGQIAGQVFDDVPDALAAWHARGIRVRIFSSGSVLAQRLLLAHTVHGDLTGWLEGFHDTTTGSKQDPDSYRAIARAFALPAAQVLMLSDVILELDAAMAAGLGTGLLLRPGNARVAPCGHPSYRDFAALG